jgi:hypothetical protein
MTRIEDGAKIVGPSMIGRIVGFVAARRWIIALFLNTLARQGRVWWISWSLGATVLIKLAQRIRCGSGSLAIG